MVIGSEGSQHSAPVGLEIKLFLESNRNRPLIPITIGDSAFGADWYPQVKGLALIDDSQEDLQAATTAADVTNRIAAALAFTKKSVRLRRIALGTALLIAATAIGAAYFLRLAA